IEKLCEASVGFRLLLLVSGPAASPFTKEEVSPAPPPVSSCWDPPPALLRKWDSLPPSLSLSRLQPNLGSDSSLRSVLSLDRTRAPQRESERSCSTTVMDVKLLPLMVLLAVSTRVPTSSAKPISLVERCWCRSTLNTVPQRSIKELKFLHTPNCPFQVISGAICSCVGNKAGRGGGGEEEAAWPTGLNQGPAEKLRCAKLKNNREVCINPETKWLQQYLKNAINK
ncbi:Stromal cell-derived factor 1, partial [Takifugu flavidus]